MREIVLDTETTGLSPAEGHRIVEIGCVELFNHIPTGKVYHQYINPQRDMPDGAFAVHGLSEERLRPEPVFAKVGDAFLEFIGDAKLVIHNASFDMKFLNAELKAMGRPVLPWEQAIDTLAIARKRYPGSPSSLDALCRRFGIDNTSRTLHGALLDSEILAEVYLELIGGKQPDLVLSGAPKRGEVQSGSQGAKASVIGARPQPLKSRLSPEEKTAHDAFVETLGDEAVWTKV